MAVHIRRYEQPFKVVLVITNISDIIRNIRNSMEKYVIQMFNSFI